MQYAGYPIVCDEVYGDGQPSIIIVDQKNTILSKEELEERPILNWLGLHAQRLIFTDMHKNSFDLEAEMPKRHARVIMAARKLKK